MKNPNSIIRTKIACAWPSIKMLYIWFNCISAAFHLRMSNWNETKHRPNEKYHIVLYGFFCSVKPMGLSRSGWVFSYLKIKMQCSKLFHFLCHCKKDLFVPAWTNGWIFACFQSSASGVWTHTLILNGIIFLAPTRNKCIRFNMV